VKDQPEDIPCSVHNYGKESGHGQARTRRAQHLAAHGWALGGRITLEGGRRRAFYGRTRRDFQYKLTAALRAQQQGQLIPLERQSTAQFLERWLTDVVQPGVRPRTYEIYGLNVRRLVPLIGRERLAVLTPPKIQAAYGALLEQGLSRRTVEQAHTVLHTALRYAVKVQLLAFNPCDAVMGAAARAS